MSLLLDDKMQTDVDLASDSSSPQRRSRSSSMTSLASLERGSPKSRTANSSSKSLRKSSSLPTETVEYLKAWMMSPEHIAHPYPTDIEKSQIMADTGIELKQLTNWFVNNRKRYWKPRVEAHLQKQARTQAVVAAAVASVVPIVSMDGISTAFPNVSSPRTTTQFVALEMSQSPPQAPPSPAIVSANTTPMVSKPVDPILEAPISVVTADNLAVYLPSASTSPHTISEISSSASDAGSVDSSFAESEDPAADSNDITTASFSVDDCRAYGGSVMSRTETVDVHILRPLGNVGEEPTIEDVTILVNVPATRILKSYLNCALTYRFTSDIAHDRKKMQSRRDAEIVRMKKHYLKLYLTEEHANRGTLLPMRKRTFELLCDVEDECTPRLKYRNTKSPDFWRAVCLTAVHHNDDALPSLEEAAYVFGYATS